MCNLRIVKRLNLSYNGNIVMYRITLNNDTREYDISKEELNDFTRDWGVKVIDGASHTVDLSDLGGNLHSSDGTKGYTITYLDLVDILRGYDDINIMGVD